jgi:glycerophosphoryl diester phosphodiesterase
MTGQRFLQSPSGRSIIDFRSRTIGVGHRGARAFAPENTIPAIRKAAAMGCPMIELDVHLSRDGEVVVHHDDDLLRCTDMREKFPGRSSAFVSDFVLEELRMLDAGAVVCARAGTSRARPTALFENSDRCGNRDVSFGRGMSALCEWRRDDTTLGEVLDVARSVDLIVNIELKTIPRMYAGIAQKVVALTVRMGMEKSVLISSFDPRATRESAANEPCDSYRCVDERPSGPAGGVSVAVRGRCLPSGMLPTERTLWDLAR